MADNEASRVIKEWFSGAYAKRNTALVDKLVHQDCIVHGLGKSYVGREAFRTFYLGLLGVMKTIELDVKQTISDGEWVAVHWEAKGVDVRGQAIAFNGGGFARVVGGQIVECFNDVDFLSFCEQRRAIEGGGLPRALDPKH